MSEPNGDLPESIYFFTFHKCASTLFSSYVLKNIGGLQHVDYATELYSGDRNFDDALPFEKRGFAYGPIRMSAGAGSPVEKLIVIPTTSADFIHDKRAIFFVRDPRDVLVSLYYSFGYSHDFSPIKEIREKQERDRKRILSNSIDDYVLNEVEARAVQYKKLYEISRIPERGVILKYEEMVDDFGRFMEKFRRFVTIEDSVAHRIYEESRPREEEAIHEHKRSGKVGGFRDKLDAGTIDELNRKLEEVLALFDYEP